MARSLPIKLTALSSCAGCAAKLGQYALSDVLKNLPRTTDRNVLVGAGTFDDAGVYRIDRERALVQTIDFFTPIVDDPYSFGQIAATNALSDVYAMGGRPLTAMNVMAFPPDAVPPEVVGAILRGGAAKVKQAGAALVGGHTIRGLEPIYGLSVTGMVDPRRILTNAGARPGDLLVLTKPLGTGIATTALKRALASPRLITRATRLMCTLNTAGAALAEEGLVRCATDVTGFGLLGHLANIVRASGVSARVDAAAVPIISPEILALIAKGCIPGGSQTNLENAKRLVTWREVPLETQTLLADAQTSGGLLLCVAPKKWNLVLRVLLTHRTPCAAVIGAIVKSKKPGIEVR